MTVGNSARATTEEPGNYTEFMEILARFKFDPVRMDILIEGNEVAGVTDIMITGPQPHNFNEVVMAEWRRLRSDGWSRVMKSDVRYFWHVHGSSGSPIRVPGFSVMLELLDSLNQPAPGDSMKIEATVSAAEHKAVLRLDPKAPYDMAQKLIELDWTWQGGERRGAAHPVPNQP